MDFFFTVGGGGGGGMSGRGATRVSIPACRSVSPSSTCEVLLKDTALKHSHSFLTL